VTGRARRWIGTSILVIWAPVTLLVTAALMVNHVVAMPAPTEIERLTGAVLALRHPSDDRRLVVHVVADGCSCTDSLFDHLTERGPQADTDEWVVFVGEDPVRERSVRDRGFALRSTTRAGLQAEFGLEAAPILIVADRAGGLAYVGGYYRYPAAVAPLDESVLSAVGRGERPDGLPIFGCAVSERLAEQLDPLGLQR
jgi:hypothetical protein